MPDSQFLKKALMICYAYPPVSASGVIRSVGFARVLPRFGWTPLILTVKKARDVNLKHGEDEPPDIEVVRTAEYNLEGLLEILQGSVNRLFRLFGGELRDKFFRELLAIPDGQIAWVCLAAGIRLARQCSVIYVSCSPYSAALNGCLIKRATGRPLVVDFRDAWTLNPHASHAPSHQRIIERMEAWVFKHADHIILNTNGAKAAYVKRYPQFAPKMSVIPNGYDQLNLARPEEPVRDPFRIMHVGAFYGSRTPDQLLAALSDTAGNIEFMQVGPSHPALLNYRGPTKVVMLDQMKHEHALDLMRTASLLYLRQGWEPQVSDYIAVAAKTYEYLATGLPILAHCPPGDNVELVKRCAATAYVVSSPDGRELLPALREAYENRFTFVPRVTSEFVSTLNRTQLTAQLANIFDSVSEHQDARTFA